MSSDNHPIQGRIYRSPINAIGEKFRDINVPDLGLWIESRAIKEQGGEVWPILSLRATPSERTWELLYAKMQVFITGLAIGTFTHCWLSDYIYDESGREVWRRPDTLKIITAKEGDPLRPEETPENLMPLVVDVSLHVARFYPRVFRYHYIGLLLLRTPLSGYNLNAEILLNFFKVAEVVTSSRSGIKPTLQRITKTSNDLGISLSSAEIKEFWKIRSRDAAHDYGQAELVDREMAVDCKLWTEEMVIRDFQDRGTSVIRKKSTQRL